MYQGAGKSAGQGGGAEEEGREDEEGAHARNVAGHAHLAALQSCARSLQGVVLLPAIRACWPSCGAGMLQSVRLNQLLEIKMKNIMTIGYEGSSIDDFLATLVKAKVNVLLDVREIPVSRRKGFSKKALAEHVASVGIAYRHERDLGSPKEIRHQLHADGDYTTYFRSFSKYIESQRPLLEELACELDGNVALVCYERDPATCHRSVVAKRLELMTGLTTKHLGVQIGTGEKRARAGAGESLSAA